MKYLFTAHFNDGTVINQTPDDRSTTDPNKSSFYDVMQRANDVACFVLHHNDSIVSVDLNDGHFEINGIAVVMNEPPPTDCKLRLIYYRRHTHSFTSMFQELSHDVDFYLGWQTTTQDGKNVQNTVMVG